MINFKNSIINTPINNKCDYFFNLLSKEALYLALSIQVNNFKHIVDFQSEIINVI
jgi:hypothetical protein